MWEASCILYTTTFVGYQVLMIYPSGIAARMDPRVSKGPRLKSRAQYEGVANTFMEQRPMHSINGENLLSLDQMVI